MSDRLGDYLAELEGPVRTGVHPNTAFAIAMIGLAFTRADAMLRVAGALPADDSRVPRFRTLAEEHARAGFETMFDADYAGSHWIGSFALRYLVQAMEGRAQ